MFQSRVFAETIATLLNIQIEVVETTGAVGAARAAGVGAGIFPTLEAALEGIRPVEIFEPKLHRGNCLEAYNYWNMMLENVLAERGLRPAAHDRFRQSQAVLKKELEAKSQETEAARQQILTKNALLEQVRQQIEAMQKKAETKSAAAELQKIARKMEADAGEKSGALELLEKRFSLAGDPFLAKMRVRFPSLSGDELQLCALLKLHFRSKELAQHFHISVRGIETRRYRLRKKLGLATDAAVVAFLEDSSF